MKRNYKEIQKVDAYTAYDKYGFKLDLLNHPQIITKMQNYLMLL